MLVKILFWAFIIYVAVLALYLIVIFLVVILVRKKNGLQFRKGNLTGVTFVQRMNEGKFFILTYEHSGGGFCRILAVEEKDFETSLLENLTEYFVFVLDDNGRVIDSHKGKGSFSTLEEGTWQKMIRLVQTFWKEKDLYE